MKMSKSTPTMEKLVQQHNAIKNDPYANGYDQARQVMDAAFPVGYCSTEESRFIATQMLDAGLTGEQARQQFHQFLDQLRASRQTGQSTGAASGSQFVRPAGTGQQMESVESINARWMREMSGGASQAQPGGNLLPSAPRG